MSFSNRRRFSQYWSTNPSNKGLGYSPAITHTSRWKADIIGVKTSPTSNHSSPAEEATEATHTCARNRTKARTSPEGGHQHAAPANHRPSSAPPGQRSSLGYNTPYRSPGSASVGPTQLGFSSAMSTKPRGEGPTSSAARSAGPCHPRYTPDDTCAPATATKFYTPLDAERFDDASSPYPLLGVEKPRVVANLVSEYTNTPPPRSDSGAGRHLRNGSAARTRAMPPAHMQFTPNPLAPAHHPPSTLKPGLHTPLSPYTPHQSSSTYNYAAFPGDSLDEQIQIQADALNTKRAQVAESRRQLKVWREQLDRDRAELADARGSLKATSELYAKERQQLEWDQAKVSAKAPVENAEVDKIQAEVRKAAAMAEAISQEREKLFAERLAIEAEIKTLQAQLTHAGLADDNTLEAYQPTAVAA